VCVGLSFRPVKAMLIIEFVCIILQSLTKCNSRRSSNIDRSEARLDATLGYQNVGNSIDRPCSTDIRYTVPYLKQLCFEIKVVLA
jgi:hypothetical protein